MTDYAKIDRRELDDIIDVALISSEDYEPEQVAAFKALQTKLRGKAPLDEGDEPVLAEMYWVVRELERMRLEEPGATEDPDRWDGSTLLKALEPSAMRE